MFLSILSILSLLLLPLAHSYPIADPVAPSDFVALSTIDPTILQDIRYTTPHNFIGVPITGYVEPLCILTLPAATALKSAQSLLLSTGYTLKVYDCYRPQRAVDHFVTWATDLTAESMKPEFYPQVDKSHLFTDGYIASRSGHSRGSVVDLTIVKLPAETTRPYVPGEPLVSCTAPKDQRFPDNSVDMATGYDCFDTLSWPADERVSAEQGAWREMLAYLMQEAGFVGLETEWWHYRFQEEPYPDTYFDFPVSWGSLNGRRGNGRRRGSGRN